MTGSFVATRSSALVPFLNWTLFILIPSPLTREPRTTLDFTAEWRQILAKAADTRRRITATPVVKVSDVEHKMRLLAEAEAATDELELVADALTGAGMQGGGVTGQEA